MMSNRLSLAIAGLAFGASIVAAVPAMAEPIKCQRDIAKAASKYVQDRSKILSGCEQTKIKGKFTPATNCLTEPGTADKLTKAATKFSGAVDKSCGGADKLCSTPTGNDTVAAIGWPSQCPNFEGGSCNGSIANCGDVAACVSCIVTSAMNQESDAIHGDLSLPSAGTLNKCQAAISKEAQKFLAAKSKILQTCWDSRLQAKHTATCPDGLITDKKHPARKAFDAIAKAEAKKVAAICKACGGADKLCGTPDDITPATIGFSSSCPTVDVPNGQLCGDINVSTLAGVVQCVDCVTEFKVDCADRAAVQGAVPGTSGPVDLASYPGDCNTSFGPTCSQLQVTVATSFTPPGGGDFVAAVGINLDYNQGRISLPGVGQFDPGTVSARIMDLTPTAGSNLVTGGDGEDSVANVGIARTSAPGVASGNFAKITFDCAPGKPSPAASNFSCVADVGTFFGDSLPGSCSVVSVNALP